MIVVVGAAGTPEYATQFAAWAKLWEQACTKSNATYMAIGLDEPGASSDLTRIQQILTDQSAETTAALWLVLIGHGTFDGRTAKFNLRGPDLSANDLADWLKPLHRPLVVIDTASSSAPFLKELSAPGRVVITATKSGFEQNFTRFGQYLAEAIIDPNADLDKDGQTSLLEAFLSASHAVAQFYAGAGRLATEHALLDDNGDGLGTPCRVVPRHPSGAAARDGAALDGHRAHQLHLLNSPAEAAIPLGGAGQTGSARTPSHGAARHESEVLGRRVLLQAGTPPPRNRPNLRAGGQIRLNRQMTGGAPYRSGAAARFAPLFTSRRTNLSPNWAWRLRRSSKIA